jgi:MFS family permease
LISRRYADNVGRDHKGSPTEQEKYDEVSPVEDETPAPSPDTPAPQLKDGGVYGWLTILAVCFVFFNTWGLVQAFGAYQSYYTTELLRDYNASTISWIGTIESFLLVFGGVVTGPIFDQGYLRSLIATGSALIVFGMMMLSLASKYYQVLLAQSICVGLGSGMLFTPALAQITIIFNRRRAIALGLSMAGSGIGGIVYPILFDHLQPKVGFGWATRTIAFIALGTLAIAVVILCWRKPDKKPPRALFDWAALKDIPFVLYGLSTFLTFTAYWIPWFYVPLYGRFAVGTSVTFSAYLLSITNACSIVGRMLPPLLQMKFTALQVLVGVHIVGDILIWCWIAIGDSFGGFVTFCVFWGLASGPMAVLPAAAVAELSPDLSTIGARMGMAWAVSSFGNLIGAPIAGAVSDPSGNDFLGGQIYAGICMAAALGLITIVVMMVYRKGKGKSDGK